MAKKGSVLSGSVRLDKFLAHNGFGSRKDVKKLLHSRTVLINDVVCTDASMHLNIENDTVSVDGEVLVAKKTAYIMLNKPQGVLSATRDPHGMPTVFDILGSEILQNYKDGELLLVGRLDIDTEGLLIITDDGEAVHRLTSPKNGITKTYYVKLEKPVNETEQQECIKKFADGIHITVDRGEAAHDCKPAQLRFLTADGTEAELIISEGKYHQVKRMFFAVDNKVIFLRRTAFGTLKLDDDLPTGHARHLSEEEVKSLLQND